ncbi:gp16 family protein [Vibrio harveyi]|uniref:gp16 family protein n=1 Tax=Vibrio harveyi TaxID=669 RepID=UPI003BB5CD82
MSKLFKLVQIGKRDLQLSDETYRDILQEITGQRSSRGLDDRKLGKIVDRMKQMGFVPVSKKRTKLSKPRALEAEKIRAIWITMSKQGFLHSGTDLALDGFVKRMTSQLNGKGVAKLVWLDSYQASYVLEALKKWHYRVMRDAVIAAGVKFPEYVSGSVGYDRLAWFYTNDFLKKNDGE